MSNNTEVIARLFYDLKEVAEMFHVDQKTVRRWIDRGLLARSKALRHIRIPKASLDAFVKSTTK